MNDDGMNIGRGRWRVGRALENGTGQHCVVFKVNGKKTLVAFKTKIIPNEIMNLKIIEKVALQTFHFNEVHRTWRTNRDQPKETRKWYLMMIDGPTNNRVRPESKPKQIEWREKKIRNFQRFFHSVILFATFASVFVHCDGSSTIRGDRWEFALCAIAIESLLEASEHPTRASFRSHWCCCCFCVALCLCICVCVCVVVCADVTLPSCKAQRDYF